MPQPSRICRFALLLPVYQLFDYEVIEARDCEPGRRFELPFGNSKKLGVLVSCYASDAHPEHKAIKAAIGSLDAGPLLSRHLLDLAAWLADYYCQPLGEVIFQFLPRSLRKAEAMVQTQLEFWTALATNEELLSGIELKAPRQFALLTALINSPQGLNAAELRQIQPAWHQPLKALVERGLVSKSWREQLPAVPAIQLPDFEPTQDQRSICDRIRPTLSRFLVHLIHGVTGSGKTEVYINLMLETLLSGRQVIYLVPEIGLTPQLFQRLQQRLGQAVISSHSGLTDTQRYRAWDQFRRGVAQVLIGTRSALFAASPSLGLIIIDEEHDASFRQQDGLRYHARDVAIKRAQMLDIPIILGSATPSLESLHNLDKAHYRLYRLDRRATASQPPAIQLLDCSQIPLTSGCSPQLLQAVKKHIENQGQVLLFLNRRGFAPVVMCHECGWQSSCHQCDARMTLHQSMNKLICHHCGFNIVLPSQCPDCAAKQIRHYGVGTEQLEAFLQTQFPGIKIIRIDRDTIGSSLQFEQKMEWVLDGKPCILVGTQMLAKGHDYPHITLVGILDADQALYSSFYRASERLIQTVLQVSGRAGRAEKKGQALLQTAFPSHPLMQSLCHKSYAELVQPILEERKMVGFPPYTRVVTFQVDAVELAMSMDKLNRLKQFMTELNTDSRIKVIGPIPALMTRRIGRYRAQLSILSAEFQPIRRLLHLLMPKIQGLKNTAKSRLTIEVDPLDL